VRGNSCSKIEFRINWPSRFSKLHIGKQTAQQSHAALILKRSKLSTPALLTTSALFWTLVEIVGILCQNQQPSLQGYLVLRIPKGSNRRDECRRYE